MSALHRFCPDHGAGKALCGVAVAVAEIVAEEDAEAKTLTAPRVRRAMEIDSLASGFTFLKTGRELDREAILGLEREKIVAVICQTDRTGAGSGIRRIAGKEWLIGANHRGEAIALVWNGKTKSRVTTPIINAALAEAKALALKTPLRIYGTTCAVSETRSFRFCQIPDEILAETMPWCVVCDALNEAACSDACLGGRREATA